MNEIVVARRDGTLKAPDGVRYRLLKGKTLADADHPAVIANPELFMPMTIALRSEAPAGTSDALDVEQHRDELLTVLEEIVEGLAERGIVDRDNMPTDVGWLSRVLFAALDARQTGAAPELAVAPPARRGGRRKAVGDAND